MQHSASAIKTVSYTHLINSSIIHTGISADWVPPLGKKVTSEQLQALARAKGSEDVYKRQTIPSPSE